MEDRQSKPSPLKVNPSCLTQGRLPINDGHFTLRELDKVLEKQSNNKSPGTDLLCAELAKYLDSRNRSYLLHCVNEILDKGTLEPSLHEARIVSTQYKKGGSSKLENYRPISRLQTFYKIIAALIKNRLSEGLDKWIMDTRYDFRAGAQVTQSSSQGGCGVWPKLVGRI